MRQIFIAAARARHGSQAGRLRSLTFLFPITDLSSILRLLIDQPGNHFCADNETTPYQSATLHRQLY